MKQTFLSLVTLSVLLTACTSTTQTSNDLQEQLKNPLFAQRYHEDMMQHMVNLVIQNDPLTKEPETMAVIDDLRQSSLQRAQEANARQSQGIIGVIISDYEYVYGEILLLEKTLYVSPDFIVAPGPALHMYLTTINDPRDAVFPDATVLDLGPINNVYGAQVYEVPHTDGEMAPDYVTAVLWDETFKRVYGFAQLRKR